MEFYRAAGGRRRGSVARGQARGGRPGRRSTALAPPNIAISLRTSRSRWWDISFRDSEGYCRVGEDRWLISLATTGIAFSIGQGWTVAEGVEGRAKRAQFSSSILSNMAAV